MNTDRARASLDPPVVPCEGWARFVRVSQPLANCRGLAAFLSLVLLATLPRSAVASTELIPFQGTASIVGGRNVAGAEGARYRLPGGIRVSLGPNAEASVVAQPQMLALTSGKRTPTYSVFLRSGTVDVDVPEGSFGAVAIAGPAEVRVIARRGQSLTLASGSFVYAYSTKYPLLVSQKERLATLAPGIIRQFSRAAPPADRPALSAPKWLAGRRVWLAVPEAAKVSDFAWSPVPDARSYTIELRQAANGQLLEQFTESSTKIGDSLPPLKAGNYELVVHATDELGLPGLASTPLRLQIVGVEVPPGARLKPDARIELSQSQTVKLSNADGLLLTRSREREKRRASEPIGIANGQPTPIVIHGEDAASPCLMWLLPSQTPVSATVGPKWVIWPQQSVDLEVRWTDALGQRLAPDVEPTVSVFVGIEPVDVVWDKEPDVWRARLAPQPGRGPWVVRLEVHDQAGGLLARDFVEVEPRPRRQTQALTSLAELTSKQ